MTWKLKMQSDCLLQRTSHSTYLYILLFVYSLHTRTFYWILFKTCTPVYLHPHRNNFFSSYFSHFWMDRNTEKLQWINIFLFLLFTLQFFVSFFLFLFSILFYLIQAQAPNRTRK